MRSPFSLVYQYLGEPVISPEVPTMLERNPLGVNNM
jgi:hypothetical protein